MIALGGLIELLSSLPPDRVVRSGFGKALSYRGDYSQIAFEPAENVTIASMLEHARSAVGQTFEGYKGGRYLMSEKTRCFIAKWGEYNGDSDAIGPARIADWSQQHTDCECGAGRCGRRRADERL